MSSSQEESDIYSEDLDSESEGIESENEQLHEISSKKSTKSSSFLPVNEEIESSDIESKNEPITTKKRENICLNIKNFSKNKKRMIANHLIRWSKKKCLYKII